MNISGCAWAHQRRDAIRLYFKRFKPLKTRLPLPLSRIVSNADEAQRHGAEGHASLQCLLGLVALTTPGGRAASSLRPRPPRPRRFREQKPRDDVFAHTSTNVDMRGDSDSTASEQCHARNASALQHARRFEAKPGTLSGRAEKAGLRKQIFCLRIEDAAARRL
ncbi:hypothetical protein B0H13DRAFT_1875798 [Mycena leptocephala]|nr:hypothetical protein B0H13DRAFT_1875798 [Mycena leptocephala]